MDYDPNIQLISYTIIHFVFFILFCCMREINEGLNIIIRFDLILRQLHSE